MTSPQQQQQQQRQDQDARRNDDSSSSSSSSSTTPTAPRRRLRRRAHHYFMLRHCIRAQKSLDVAFGSQQTTIHGQPIATDPYDYLGNIPAWAPGTLGTCLPVGNDMAQATGAWLVKQMLLSSPEQQQPPQQSPDDDDDDKGDDPSRRQSSHRMHFDLIADDMIRDVDTAYYIKVGLAQGLEELNAQKNHEQKNNGAHPQLFIRSSGLKEMHMDANFFTFDDDFDTSNVQALQRLRTLAHPTLDFREAVDLMQSLAGVGKLGNLTTTDDDKNKTKIPFALQPDSVDPDEGKPGGVAPLLDYFARGLFYAKGGQLQPSYCPKATVRQVFQFVQYIHWYVSVAWSNNNWAARNGAVQAHVLMQVLKHGSYWPTSSSTSSLLSSLPSEDDLINASSEVDDDNDDEATESSSSGDVKDSSSSSDEGDGDDNEDDDDNVPIDTYVTILLGHNADLHSMATALDATWILKEPYLSGPNGDFLPTVPLSGIHAVRYIEQDDSNNNNNNNNNNDQIALSFVYPMIIDLQDGKLDLDGTYFPTNTSGILEETPLLIPKLNKDVKHSFRDDHATYIQSSSSTSTTTTSTSWDILERHIVDTVGGYDQVAAQWYHECMDEAEAQTRARPLTSQTTTTARGGTVHNVTPKASTMRNGSISASTDALGASGIFGWTMPALAFCLGMLTVYTALKMPHCRLFCGGQQQRRRRQKWQPVPLEENDELATFVENDV